MQCVHAVNLQNYFNEIFKMAICENLDPRKFSAIRYNNLVLRDFTNSQYACQLSILCSNARAPVAQLVRTSDLA